MFNFTKSYPPSYPKLSTILAFCLNKNIFLRMNILLSLQSYEYEMFKSSFATQIFLRLNMAFIAYLYKNQNELVLVKTLAITADS